MNSAQQVHSAFSRGRTNKRASTKRAFSFSLIIHLGLLAFLMIGINWKTSTPAGVEVELWDQAPQVETLTPAAPEIKAEIKEEAAEIALKKKPVEPEPPKKAAVKEIVRPAPIVKPPAPKEEPKKVEAVKKVDPPKKEPVKEVAKASELTPTQIKANAEADKRRAANIASLRGLAANDGGSGGTVGSGVGGGGNAPPGWSDKVIKKVRANITFNAETFKGNKQTIIQVKLAPDGAILTKVMTSSSGDAAWDQAVLSAIDATQSLPKDDNGQFPTLTPELKLKPK